MARRRESAWFEPCLQEAVCIGTHGRCSGMSLHTSVQLQAETHMHMPNQSLVTSMCAKHA